MSGGTFTMPSSMFLISQSSSNRLRSDTSMTVRSGLFVLIRGGGGWLLKDLVRFCPDRVLSPLVSFDSRPMPESWLELELFLEDSSLLELTSLLSPLVLLVAVFVLTTFPLLEVRVTFLGEPLGEFFSAVDSDSSLLFVCGVLPAPELVLGPGDPEDPGPGPLEPILLWITRLLEALPLRLARTGEFSGFPFPARRLSPASPSVSRDFIFMFSPAVSASSGCTSWLQGLFSGCFFLSLLQVWLGSTEEPTRASVWPRLAEPGLCTGGSYFWEKRGWKLRHTRPSWLEPAKKHRPPPAARFAKLAAPVLATTCRCWGWSVLIVGF